MFWFVLYTKSRNEKLVADKLTSLGIQAYCPVIRRTRKWSDRKKVIEEPLIRSYCFVRLTEKERNLVFKVTGIVGYLFWLKKPAIVKDSEIEKIKWMLGKIDHKYIQLRGFEPGDRIKIESGAFIDHSGEVQSQQGTSLTLVLESLQLVIKVDLNTTVISNNNDL